MAHSYSQRRGLETSSTCILSFLDIVIKKYYNEAVCVSWGTDSVTEGSAEC